MTTITIENGNKLSRTVFKTFEDLIDEYYESKGLVALYQIDYDDLSTSEKKSIDESIKMGKDNLTDFQG